MTDLLELYQELILDHNRRPRNRGTLGAPDHEAEGFNPLCGDRIEIDLALDGDTIRDIRFEGRGCAISTAAASLMSEAVKGKTVAEANTLFRAFHELVTHPAHGAPSTLGKLRAFAGVGRFPARVKCATLAWHTLLAALEDRDDTVTTE